MRIGTLGTGRMGAGLGRLWAERGHDVLLGSRDPARARAQWDAVAEAEAALVPGGAAPRRADVAFGSYRDAVEWGDIVLLAVPWGAVEDTLRDAEPFADHVLIDATNPFSPEHDGPAVGHTTSGAEHVQRLAPGACVVKAFHTIHHDNLTRAVIDGHRQAVFYCGDDRYARARVRILVEDLGFDPVDAGPLHRARLLEPLAFLWIRLVGDAGRSARSGLAWLEARDPA